MVVVTREDADGEEGEEDAADADDGDGERAVATRRRRREKRIVFEDSGGDCAATDADEDRE